MNGKTPQNQQSSIGGLLNFWKWVTDLNKKVHKRTIYNLDPTYFLKFETKKI